MERSSIGGRANWAGAAFELRLGVEFCVYILLGDIGLGPGAASRVQLQAPQVVDDLILEFETGARWAVQAKAGPSLRVEWNPQRPFGKALCQLYAGATSGQIDLAAASLDRVELAVDHRAPATVTAFGEWLAKARHHYRWEEFVAASTGKERDWARELPALLGAEPSDDLLAFLKKLYLRRTPAPDHYRSDLRGRLMRQGVPDAATADRALDLLLARVARAAPHAGWLNYDELRSGCEGIPGLLRPGAPPFRLFRCPSEDELYRALKMPPDRPARFVARPELAAALEDERGLLLAGRPGSGKSHALIKLALAVRLGPSTSSGQAHDEARPDWPVVVIAPHFRADDLGRLVAALRRVHTPYQLLWDDVHEKPALFADAVSRLAEMGDGLRVLAAYRDAHERAVQERVTPDLCRRVGIPGEPLRLRSFDADQAALMAGAVADLLGLALDEAAREAFARHVQEGDGGPLFALSTGKLLREVQEQSGRACAADVDRLPDDLLQTWRHLYHRLADRPAGSCLQGLLSALNFLHRISCPLNGRLAELLFTRVLEYRRGEFESAARTLAREGWLRQEGEEFGAHDVTLEGVEGERDGFERFARLAREESAGEELPLGLLRCSLSLFWAGQIPRARTGRERRALTVEAVELNDLAIADFRAIGHAVHMSTALNNASNRYSDLAGLEESRAGRVGLLERALAAVEEAAGLYRELGLRADLAMALGTANLTCRAVAEASDSPEEEVAWLRRALESIEEAVELFRAAGIVRYLIQALRDCVICQATLAQHTGELDRARVLALCREGESLCGPMEDHDRLAFFRQVRQQLE